jgi:catechol 2,3-dioxygenase-like lactoylglutathione lyase family enzyme
MTPPALPAWNGTSTPILPTASMDRTVAFYRGLGFTVELYRDGGYAFATSTGRADGVILHFSLTDSLDPFVSAGMAYVTVDDVDALYAQIMATGLIEEAITEDGQSRYTTRELKDRWRQGLSLARISRPWDQPWGKREFAMIDPDNNLIRVGHDIV